MTDKGKQKVVCYLLPVVLSNDVYVPLPGAGQHQPCDSAFLRYLERNHERLSKEVKIGDVVFTSLVYVTKDPTDCSFAAVDEQMRPLGGTQRPCLSREPVDDYLARLKQIVSSSEAIFPGQVAHIPSHYVQPEVCFWHGPNATIAIEDLPETKRLLIVGEPGAGKTTLLRHLALNMMRTEEDTSEDNNTIRQLPIYVSLRHWTDPRDVSVALHNTLINTGGDWVAANFHELAEQGSVVLLFDGLDEVTERVRHKVVHWLEHFGDRYSKVQIIVASRPHVKAAIIPGYTLVTIKPFDTNRVRDFAYRRLYGDKSWRRFVSCYRECDDMHHVLGNPLLLSIATYLYGRSNTVPQNSAQLLKDFVLALTDTWDSSRGVKRHCDQDFTPERSRNALGRLAFNCLVQCRSTFTDEDAASWLEVKCGETEARSNLERLQQITGLLCLTHEHAWSFSHRIFMDFFAASYAIDRAEGVSGLFSEHSKEVTWRRTWGHAAGLTSDPDYLCRLYTDRTNADAPAVARRATAVMLESIVIGAKTLSYGTRSLVSALETCVEDLKATTETVIDHDRDGRESGSGEFRLAFAARSPRKTEIAELGGLIQSIKMIRWTAYGEELLNRLRHSDNAVVVSLSQLLRVRGTMVVRTDESSIRITWERESPELPNE